MRSEVQVEVKVWTAYNNPSLWVVTPCYQMMQRCIHNPQSRAEQEEGNQDTYLCGQAFNLPTWGENSVCLLLMMGNMSVGEG